MEILDEMWDFYTKLYDKKDAFNIEDTSFCGIGEKLPKLNENEKNKLESDISNNELKEAIKKTKNNKSPGPDGFSNEFYSAHNLVMRAMWVGIQRHCSGLCPGVCRLIVYSAVLRPV